MRFQDDGEQFAVMFDLLTTDLVASRPGIYSTFEVAATASALGGVACVALLSLTSPLALWTILGVVPTMAAAMSWLI